MFSNFSSVLLSLMLLCFQVQACYGSSNQVVKNQTGYEISSVKSEESLKPASEFSSSKLKIQDNVARAGLLYDLFSDTIVWEKNMHEAYPIASLTKMMVGLLVIEDIYAGKISWNSMIRVTPAATRAGGFMVSLKKGSSVSAEDLLKAAVISSGNDAAYLLAQFLGGTEQKFVNLPMLSEINDKIRRPRHQSQGATIGRIPLKHHRSRSVLGPGYLNFEFI